MNADDLNRRVAATPPDEEDMPPDEPMPGGQQPSKRRRRRWQVEIGEESEEWVVSYMDMVTLMMCAFVVIAALLDVRIAKMQPLGEPAVAMQAVQIVPPVTAALATGAGESEGGAASNPSAAADDVGGASASGVAAQAAPSDNQKTLAAASLMPAEAQAPAETGEDVKVEAAWREAIAAQGLGDRISIAARGRTVTMQIQDEILFPTGSAELQKDGADVLRRLAPLLAHTEGDIRVEGHTDDVPIDNDRYPSNWELSSARATSVVRTLIDAGIAPNRLRATGYADTKPVASNADASGRARNRRVSLVIEH
jgi:chemotaxis protein MotB